MCRNKDHGGRRCGDQNEYSRVHRNLMARKQYDTRVLNSAADDGAREKATKRLAELNKTLETFNEARDVFGVDITPHHIDLPNDTVRVIRLLESKGFTPLLVGGSVRDSFLGFEPKDADIEVYGGSAAEIIPVLKKLGKVDSVGKAFGVLKLTFNKEEYDISLPRRDNKTGATHRDFEVEVDPEMSYEEASSRRDYTINALMYSHKYQVIVDPHGGVRDMKNNLLRHVSDAFDEDPLRVLRGVQMAARFNMNMHPDTIKKAESLKTHYSTISSERVAIEFEKLFNKHSSLSRGFKVLKETGWDDNFPGLKEINNESLHSELENIASKVKESSFSNTQKSSLIASTVAHKMSSSDRETFLQKVLIGDTTKRHARSLLQDTTVNSEKFRDSEVRMLAKELKNCSIEEWALLREASGENIKPILSAARRLRVNLEPEKPLVLGRDLLEADSDLKPGKWMGEILDKALTAQYEGAFRTQQKGLEWVLNEIKKVS